MSFPRGVSIVTSAAPSASTGASSVTTTASSVTRPAARRNAWVHGVHRGTRPSFSMFDWHLWEQNRNTGPSFRMNILPVPGSISLPQKEQDRRGCIGSPDRELAGLAGGLAVHADVPDLHAPLHLARADAALLLAQERHVSEDLFGLDVLRHDDELGFAAFDELRDFVRPFADFPALLRELDRLIRLVDELLRHLETNVHRLGHCGDLLPPRYAGRHQSSAPRPRRSAARSGAAYKRFATVANHRSQTTCRRPPMRFIDWTTRLPRRQIPIPRLLSHHRMWTNDEAEALAKKCPEACDIMFEHGSPHCSPMSRCLHRSHGIVPSGCSTELPSEEVDRASCSWTIRFAISRNRCSVPGGIVAPAAAWCPPP